MAERLNAIPNGLEAKENKSFLQVRILSWQQKIKNMEKLLNIKILRPITIPILGAILVVYIIVAYVFDLDM